MLYECAGGAVQCPPEEVPKCPDWTRESESYV